MLGIFASTFIFFSYEIVSLFKEMAVSALQLSCVSDVGTKASET